MKGSVASTILSFDCMMSDASVSEIEGSKVPVKSIFALLSPILIGIAMSIFWVIFFLIVRKFSSYLRKCLMVSLITTFYLIHPTLTEQAFSLFLCTDLEDAGTRLETDLNVECWKRGHLIWALPIGIPMIILWVIGMPIVGFFLLYINRKKLDEKKVMESYVILYQGLRRKHYYWEIVNTLRKVIILSLNILINEPIYKALSGCLFLIFMMRVQDAVRPYNLKVVNDLESREILTSLVTLYGAVLFVQEDPVDFFTTIAMIIIALMNLYFFTYMIYAIASF